MRVEVADDTTKPTHIRRAHWAANHLPAYKMIIAIILFLSIWRVEMLLQWWRKRREQHEYEQLMALLLEGIEGHKITVRGQRSGTSIVVRWQGRIEERRSGRLDVKFQLKADLAFDALSILKFGMCSLGYPLKPIYKTLTVIN